MKFSLVTLGLAALAVASPIAKRQEIFSNADYDSLSISGGVAGNGEQEALEKLGGLPNDLTTVSEADITFLGRVNRICNEAETGAFNPAIEAASGEEADALKRGKTKNKILKLTATMLRLQIQQAQGEDVTEKMAAEQKKLDNNINADREAAGQPSTALSFDANTAQ